jgi:DNA-binding response OmpR family regulator
MKTDKKNILIIEDDEFFREIMSKKLFMSDFDVSEAIDGQKGIEKVRETNPDLVILDLLLPKIDGFEVLSTLKSDRKTASIPVIILSNLDSKEDIERGLKLGASDFLIKSQFDSDEVINKIKSFL